MLILNVWHPDVREFISAKRVMGRITNANISVGLTDDFMAAVEADADWPLVFPDTGHPDYETAWIGDLAAWQAAGRPVIQHKTVRARELWNELIESAWASAEPGLWFSERSNKMSNSHYYAPLICTNPCVTGDTLIYTGHGLVRARELAESRVDPQIVLDGRFGEGQVSGEASPVFRTGRKPVYRLQTREGYSLRATADHRVMTPQGWVEIGQFRSGDQVHILNQGGLFGTEGSLELGRTLGWLVGDGTIKKDRAVLSFFGAEKATLAPLFAQHVNDLVAPLTTTARDYPVGIVSIADRDEARVQSWRLRALADASGLVETKHRVPETVFKGTADMQRGFLQALFTADGSFQDGGPKGGSTRLASSALELIEDVQRLLLNFGVASRIYTNRRQAGYRQLPDGKGSRRAYWCRAQHELVISKDNLIPFAEQIGFLLDSKQTALTDYIARGPRGPYAERFVATVAAITPDGIEDVYDLNEPLTHSFVANGIVVHNCGEQPLPGWAVCNLGALNLGAFAKDGAVDWETLSQAVRYAVRFLDNVIDATPYFFDENKAQQKTERRVGLGTMGLAELMVRCSVRYGSPEGNQFLDQLYQFIAAEAYLASSDNAAEKGPFPLFEAEPYLDSGFMRGMPEVVRDAIATQGCRNVTVLTQAPTGTTGTMVATSTGIEPFFSWTYYRKSRLGLHEERVAVVEEWLAGHPDQPLPDYFVTAMDLTPEEHVGVQASIQRWVDSSISKTCNVPNSYSVDETRALYEYMYRMGCKGGTVYRDGSRDEQVLNLKEDKVAEPVAGSHPPLAQSGSEAKPHASTQSDSTSGADSQAGSRAQSHLQSGSAARPGTTSDAISGVVGGSGASAGGGASTGSTVSRVIRTRPRHMVGTTYRIATPLGKAYITVNRNPDGEPFEVFVNLGKAGSDLAADAEALGRLISLIQRLPSPLTAEEKMQQVIEELDGIGGSRTIGFGADRVRSLPDGIAHALSEDLSGVANEVTGEQKSLFPGADLCPVCGHASFVHVEGCQKCYSCGHSEC